ncbi:Ig-like domain-containing protein [Candidatus Blastococcus massiliensis]|uniref:Ig-like domain-containing protein n=1 Tax=Candidatus Blastococcus massiliensis TaxID=1470358 RepID=UPI0004BB12B4|nr:Ig-like domain-containing protein [Candidatus Blastococcus massiliensis]
MRALTVAAAAALVLLPAVPAWAAPNQAPVAVDDVADVDSIGIDRVIPALANDTDPDGDPLTYTAVGPAAKGVASIDAGRLLYRPFMFGTGTDSFTYTVSDGQGNTATATVTVTLWARLPAPTGLTISSADAASATLVWPAAPGAVQYRIYRNTWLVHTTSSTTWTDTGIPAGANYDYRIASVDGGGFGGLQSGAVYRGQQARTPTDLAVSVTTDPTALTLTWANGDLGPWNVYRDGALVATPSTRTFTDTGLVTGRAYSYQVQTAGYTSPTAVNPPSALSSAVRGTPALSAIAQLVEHRDLISSLGPVTVPERAIPGGRQQDHQNGLVLQQDGEDPFVVGHGGFPAAYAKVGGATGQLGFPIADVECTDVRAQGCIQFFEGGSIVHSRAHWSTPVVLQVIEDGWAATGWEDGPLGWPIFNQRATARGVIQPFEGGYVLWTPTTGSHGVSQSSGFLDAWDWDLVYETGRLGYPTSDMACGLRAAGCFQQFEGGAIYSSLNSGVHAMYTPYLDTWTQHGWENGRLGYPTAGEVCGLIGGGCFQKFEGGAIYGSPVAGRHVVAGPVYTAWSRTGSEKGRLGYPTSGETCGLPGGGCSQSFQGGALYWTAATGAQVSVGAIRDTYLRAGGVAGRLGYPTTGEHCGLARAGCLQLFQGGAIYFSPATGAHVVLGAIRGTWNNAWSQDGRLGYPTTSEICGLRRGGCFQEFQGGAIYFSPASGAHVVLGAIRDTWARQGWETGRLGYPTSSEFCGLRGGGCFQEFQGGAIYFSPASGAHVVLGGIRDTWARQGWETGRLGYPVSGESFSGGAYRQTFQGGTITLDGRGPRITYR